MLEKTTRINFLFDFYQELLTPKQRSYMEMYYLEDYSLGEISEGSNVSRQAVYDNIRRTETMLEAYEEKLQLYDRFKRRNHLLELMEQALEKEDKNKLKEIMISLKELD
ncbi:putative DNA-binding protein [Sediminibacillus massiliensis]|uniref:putative DNA-binding protein n=1 Tax=Sediminibacillus massiliensis TaxID=1926277 RepID=UPI0009886B4E|nr:putative DNA-binding protein [Sediminibacillus massiliensis]